ncbi:MULTISPECIES: tripartite tricarboxylate transporter TctB family protein [Halorussus]|uniref:tripartite tricarboxylate transporter TctB family protein n=1 Tax=Halorussus TaxID=1070314 RepID=UPI00209CC220|nr:tripartite tricarboxylate transporter TctB family protein [Halorussus vallis]USZ74993.1 tripartite tricarboxylate transporter TctB family protein [Halorussus vallis]
MIKGWIGDVADRTSGSSISSSPLSLGFILLSLVVIYTASTFPEEGTLGPGFFPMLISVGIIVFAAIDLLNETETELEMTELDFRSPAVVLGLLVAYVFLMPITGFLVGSMLFLPVFLYYSNIRSKPTLIALSIGLPILLFYIFGRIFLVRLPEGIIPFSRLLPRLPLGVMF